MFNRTFTIITALLMLLISETAAFASASANNIASVIAVRGEVQAIGQDGIFRELRLKDPLYLNDSIDTGAKGRIQILFTDNTIISLGRKSILKISDYFLAEDKTGKIKTTVSEGVFRVMGGILTKTSPDKFLTETPSGNIGIRGSMYSGQVSGKKLVVLFEGGRGITVSNNTGVVTISVPGLGTTTVGINQPIQTPYTFTDANLNFIHQELSFTLPSGTEPTQSNQRLHATPSFTLSEIVETPATPPDSPEAPKKHRPSEIQEENKLEELTDTGPDKDFETDFFKLSNQIRNNQKDASQIFRNAVTNQGMALDSALGAVLMGMMNSSRESFDSVMNEAIEMGITAEQTKEIAEIIRASGVCP